MASGGSGERLESIPTIFDDVVRSGTERREQQAAAVQKEQLNETSRADEKKNDQLQRKPRTIFQRITSTLGAASNETSRVRAQNPTAIEKERLNETSGVDEKKDDQLQRKPRTIFQRVLSVLRCGNSAAKGVNPGDIKLRENPVKSVPPVNRDSEPEMTVDDMLRGLQGNFTTQRGAREGEPNRTVAPQAGDPEGEPNTTVATQPGARDGEPSRTVANMPEKDRENIRKGKMHEVPQMEKMQTMDKDSD